MAKNLPYLVCPVCFRNLCLKRTRLKRDRPHYNLWDKTKPIIYIRECRGGKNLKVSLQEDLSLVGDPGQAFQL